jgi:adenosylmethionine-8-amino-7-oxononanoate aminotransferase
MSKNKLEHSLAAFGGNALPIAVRGSGCRIWDREGREYIDACGGAMVMTLGHRHPRLIEAAKRQLDQLTFAYRFSFSNEPMADLSEMPPDDSRPPRKRQALIVDRPSLNPDR